MRHRFDVLSLVLGLLFGAVAIAALTGALAELVVDADLWTPQVAVATGAILVGLAVLGAVVSLLSRRPRAADDTPVAPAPDGDG